MKITYSVHSSRQSYIPLLKERKGKKVGDRKVRKARAVVYIWDPRKRMDLGNSLYI